MFDDMKAEMKGLREDLTDFRIDLKETQKDANLQIRSLRRDILTLNKSIQKLTEAINNQ